MTLTALGNTQFRYIHDGLGYQVSEVAKPLDKPLDDVLLGMSDSGHVLNHYRRWREHFCSSSHTKVKLVPRIVAPADVVEVGMALTGWSSNQ